MFTDHPVITVTDPKLINLTEQKNYERNGVRVTLEWIEGRSLHTYYISVVPSAPFIFNGSTLQSVIFDLSYNISYNVTVQVELLCGKNVTIFAKLLYFCKFIA